MRPGQRSAPALRLLAGLAHRIGVPLGRAGSILAGGTYGGRGGSVRPRTSYRRSYRYGRPAPALTSAGHRLEQIRADGGPIGRWRASAGGWAAARGPLPRRAPEGSRRTGAPLAAERPLRPPAGCPTAPTRPSLVLYTRLPQAAAGTLELDGTYRFDAISPDGRCLYLVEYANPRRPARLPVRRYDVGAGSLGARSRLGEPDEPSETSPVSSTARRRLAVYRPRPPGRGARATRRPSSRGGSDGSSYATSPSPATGSTLTIVERIDMREGERSLVLPARQLVRPAAAFDGRAGGRSTNGDGLALVRLNRALPPRARGWRAWTRRLRSPPAPAEAAADAQAIRVEPRYFAPGLAAWLASPVAAIGRRPVDSPCSPPRWQRHVRRG